MSLKAKLEAVIYAAEEPVTLTQLAALFAADAMEWKAAQQAAAAEQAAEVAGEPPESAESAPLLAEGLEYLGLENTAGMRVPESEPQSESAVEAAPSGDTAPAIEAADSDAAEPVAAEPVDAESEARRLARQRDREIKGTIKQLLDELIVSYASDERGIEIREIAGGYRMATKPECHDAVRLFVKSLKPPMKLSLPALETLAVVAYKQPVTSPEVNEIRGVESGGVLGSLLSRKLIATAGRKPVIGRPILYKTTREFLLRFGLKDLSELPSMEEFEKMAAAEIAEMEPEAAAADAAEAPLGDMAEEAAENRGDDERAMLEGNSPSGDEMALELAEDAKLDEAVGEEPASLPANAAASSNQPEAAPAGAEFSPAENETVPHAQEEKDER
ncbi:MAG TPA: SMC-Scp complex subunit ScpB [Terracidiphilus sp.]|jgi:segregation and condensation protein B|nr:SMC-Scp complex subunit ScpB [Terracidiphilus sp.]